MELAMKLSNTQQEVEFVGFEAMQCSLGPRTDSVFRFFLGLQQSERPQQPNDVLVQLW
jgi:hypothetical protein